MRRFVPNLLMTVLGVAGLALAFEVATFDLPIYLDRISTTYVDPSGHLKHVVVTGPELLLKALLVVACLGYAVSVYRWTKTRKASQVRSLS